MIINIGLKEFKIPEGINPKTLNLILNTESMDNEEKQHWLEIYPSLSRQHKGRLHEILDNERIKLEILEEKYKEALKIGYGGDLNGYVKKLVEMIELIES